MADNVDAGLQSIIQIYKYINQFWNLNKLPCNKIKYNILLYNKGGDFVHSACWIQGFYIYTELKDRFDESGYYGIPKDIDMDGLTNEGRLCRTTYVGSGMYEKDIIS